MTRTRPRGCGVPPQTVSRSCGGSPQSVFAAARRKVPLLFKFPLLRKACLLILLFHLSPLSAQPPTQRVGLPLTLTDLYIPGGQAQPKPRLNREPPLVLRLLETKPAADGFRYDLEIYGLEPGTYNIADYLEALDPAEPPKFPEFPLIITTALPPGLPKPNDVVPAPPEPIGGYRVFAWTLGILWLLGLVFLIFWKRRATQSASLAVAPPTLAERLHRLVTAASQGSLDTDQQATLERLLLGHWRQKLPDIAALPPAEALARLRHHPDAGPLLQQLERWLHGRGYQLSKDEIDALLAPYRG